MVNTPRAAVQETRRRLENAGLESAQFESRILVETVLELPYGAPLPEQPLTETQQQRLAELTARRCDHEPLQYLCGTWEFFGLEFRGGRGRPHPTAGYGDPGGNGAGTAKGCAVYLSAGSLQRFGLYPGGGIGASAGCHRGSAGTVAGCPPYLRQNLHRHAPQLQCCAGDVLCPPAALLEQQYHIITCNPPYLTAADMEQLQPEVAHEPETALFGGTDGLDFYRKLTMLWKPALLPGGWLVYEVGAGQAADVEQIFRKNGYAQVHTVPDLTGIGRVVLGQKAEI